MPDFTHVKWKEPSVRVLRGGCRAPVRGFRLVVTTFAFTRANEAGADDAAVWRCNPESPRGREADERT
jgi:hypothetical protein